MERVNFKELDKLQKMLDKAGILYGRYDWESEIEGVVKFEQHHLYSEDENKYWSVICNTYSDGSDKGLLEFWQGCGDVEGWLTAEGALKLIKEVRRNDG